MFAGDRIVLLQSMMKTMSKTMMIRLTTIIRMTTTMIITMSLIARWHNVTEVGCEEDIVKGLRPLSTYREEYRERRDWRVSIQRRAHPATFDGAIDGKFAACQSECPERRYCRFT